MKAYLDTDEIDELERAARCLRDRLLIRLLFRLGCRVSEALAIEVHNADMASGNVTIQHLKTRSRLDCPYCGTRLGRSHELCPRCGKAVTAAIRKELARRQRGKTQRHW